LNFAREKEIDMNSYSRCLHCNSKNILPDLGVMDAGAYPSGSHKVSIDRGFTDRLLSDVVRHEKGGTSLIRAHVCLDCGFTAIFAQDLKELTSS
jgi:predicted Zn-ribbon and HTH transcriptional regulator